MRRAVLVLLCLSALLLASCQTKVVTEYEYVPVPVELDLTDVVRPVLERRPDNSEIRIVNPVQDVDDIVHNSVCYMYAWEAWEAYANALEGTLVSIRDQLKPEET